MNDIIATMLFVKYEYEMLLQRDIYYKDDNTTTIISILAIYLQNDSLVIRGNN